MTSDYECLHDHNLANNNNQINNPKRKLSDILNLSEPLRFIGVYHELVYQKLEHVYKKEVELLNKSEPNKYS